MIPVYGASLLRNGVKYDYPFNECLTSLAGLCEEVFIALGKSEDGTEAAVAAHPDAKKFKIIPTVWDENLRQSGLILSEQTNIAVNGIRENHHSGWVICLQADEILSDHDFAQIRQDIAQAEATGCDAIRFRYLHFWHSYHEIAYQKRWYGHEIRAFRLGKNIESFGDAQSFRGWTKLFQSDVAVFHYGHVREPAAYARKLKEFHRWWHSDEEMKKIWSKGEKRDKVEKTLRYLGPHASFMAKRIQEAPALADGVVTVWGHEKDWDARFLKRIRQPLHWTKNLSELKAPYVLLDDLSFFEQLRTGFRFKSRVPKQMLRDDSRPWTKEFWALMRFSEGSVQLL